MYPRVNPSWNGPGCCGISATPISAEGPAVSAVSLPGWKSIAVAL
jgi:hypothetical protein